MIPGVDLIQFIIQYSWVGASLIIFAESGLLIGFFLPGDTLLFTAGYLAQAHLLNIDIHLLVLILFAAAVIGDSVGYAFGNKVGRKLYNREGSRVFKKEHLEAAEKFYEKYGSKTVVIARFVPAVRTFAPIVAGASKMKYGTFLLYNLIGAFLWAVCITYLGYFLGGWFHSMGLEIDQVLLPALVVIVLISWIPAIIHLIRNPSQRKSLIRMAKKQFDQIVGEDEPKDKTKTKKK